MRKREERMGGRKAGGVEGLQESRVLAKRNFEEKKGLQKEV